MLITEEYREQITQLHSDRPDWGTTGRRFAPMVKRIVEDYVPLNILDYGCGKQTLARALPEYRIRGYDPGLPGLDERPPPHDLVVCTDVLEHVEPDLVDDVLDDLQRLTKSNLFIQVDTREAIHILPDGRNAHLTIQPCRWWVEKLWERFELISVSAFQGSFQGLFGAKNPKGNGSK